MSLGGPSLLVFVRPEKNLISFSKNEQKLRSTQNCGWHCTMQATLLSCYIKAANGSSEFSGSEERYFRTMSTSHVVVYLGIGGIIFEDSFHEC